ncbi:MAG: 2-amino-4-hydroxy-6-hydroxymethyldihydropteridine diphosphokinase [Lachnospiraceae bacterium]|nr:2-amino-4-hydroxy-6-hydroxymethyldihydropteridine diphosphokinase [Lachnospiraceae bacterium]
MDQIRIKNLRVYAYHGVYEQEKEKGQNFCVSAVLSVDMEQAGTSDEIGDAVDYGAVCLFIAEFMQENRFDLLEAVAGRLAEAVLFAFPAVKRIELEVDKPDAPIPLRFDSVSVRIERGWHRVFIALGSNMGDKLGYLERAVSNLQEDSHFRNIKVSDYIETAPYGGVEQGDFLNGVLEAETLYSPESLLVRLQKEEQLAGRTREVHWGPRTLDLDILFYDELILMKKELTIPHPDMKNRLFVLEPLAALAPHYVHPVYRRSVGELLAELKASSVL